VAACLISAAVLLLPGITRVSATDGEPLQEIGIYSWLQFQQKKFFTEITEISIHNKTVTPAKTSASLYEPIFFENQDETNHRLIFIPDMNNDMEYGYTTPVIAPGERWGVEIHNFGVFPYQCTLHPEEHGVVSVQDL
jgi:plastocyanin